MIDQFVSRFGLPPIEFSSDQARWDYARDCQRIRDSLPSGECRVAPRVSLATWRGRPLASGATVVAEDFGANESGQFRLEELVYSGHVLRSEKPSAPEIAEIAAHVQKVRALNAAFVADTPAAKLDRLLEQN